MDSNFNDDELFDTYSLVKETKALKELLITYEFKGKEELGKSLPRFNRAIRIDVLKDHRSCIIRDPVKLKEVFDYFSKKGELYYGLQVELGSNTCFVHALLKTNKGVKGIWFYDYNKPLSTNKVIQITQILEQINVKEAIVVTNLFSGHAKDFVLREEKETGIKIKLLYSTETSLDKY